MIRRTLAVLALLFIALAMRAGDQEDGVQVGDGETFNPVTSTALTVPAGAEWATISVRNAGVHMEFDGTAATTDDLYLPPGVYVTAYKARGVSASVLSSIRIIDSTDGASVVTVEYFRRP